MGCSATRSLYKVYLVVGGNNETCHEYMHSMFSNDKNIRIMNLDSHDFESTLSSILKNNENYKHLKSNIQNRGILFALFVQHDFDGLIIYSNSDSLEQYEELLEVASIQWDTTITQKECTLLCSDRKTKTQLLDKLNTNYPAFNFHGD